MGFIVAIEDDLVVILEECCGSLPPGFESSVVGDDVTVITAEVMGVEDRVGTFRGDIIEVLDHGLAVCGVYSASHGSGDQSFHHDWDAWWMLEWE